MRNEQHLLQLRPDLDLDTSQSGPEEVFQNTTLRPILKMQHNLLAQLFFSQAQIQRSAFFTWTEPIQKEWIANTIRSNSSLRQLLIGTIIGHFTLAELHTFEANASALRRRMIQLLTQRLQSIDFNEVGNPN